MSRPRRRPVSPAILRRRNVHGKDQNRLLGPDGRCHRKRPGHGPGPAAAEDIRARIGASTVAGRIAEVEDMIGWILFLASPEAGYLMGQTITVNGGRLMV